MNRQVGAARPLNSIMIAVGAWDVTLKGGRWMDQIFPSSSSGTSSSEEVKPSIYMKRNLWGATMDCKLSLAADGTFMLTPKGDHSGNFVMKGQWTCFKNPYCVTDRFYDQLFLRSYPREKITTLIYDNNNNSNSNRNSNRSTTTKQQVQITLNCRMWGKYDRRQKWFKAFSEEESSSSEANPNSEEEHPCGKLTHGTIVYIQKEVEQGPSFPWKNMFCPVLASFSAMRTSNEPCHEGWIDKDYFGY
jgi:hypothetical protein